MIKTSEILIEKLTKTRISHILMIKAMENRMESYKKRLGDILLYII